MDIVGGVFGGIPGARVSFDIANSAVSVTNVSYVLPTYLLAMAASALYVMLEPRFVPRGGPSRYTNETAYPAWMPPQAPYPMLRSSGGEMLVKGYNKGFWTIALGLRP